jgi:hypothetical protein
MPAAKTESAEAVRRAFVASVISYSPMFARACTVRGTPGFSPSTDWGRDRGCPARGFGCPVLDEELRMLVAGSLAARGQSPRAGFRGSRRLAVRHRVSRPTRHRGGPHAGFGLWSFHFPMLPTGHAYVAGWPRLSADQRNSVTRTRTECNTRVTDFRRPAERCRRAKDRRWQCQGFRA